MQLLFDSGFGVNYWDEYEWDDEAGDWIPIEDIYAHANTRVEELMIERIQAFIRRQSGE